jgi:hypothetical protein
MQQDKNTQNNVDNQKINCGLPLNKEFSTREVSTHNQKLEEIKYQALQISGSINQSETLNQEQKNTNE